MGKPQCLLSFLQRDNIWNFLFASLDNEGLPKSALKEKILLLRKQKKKMVEQDCHGQGKISGK